MYVGNVRELFEVRIIKHVYYTSKTQEKGEIEGGKRVALRGDKTVQTA